MIEIRILGMASGGAFFVFGRSTSRVLVMHRPRMWAESAGCSCVHGSSLSKMAAQAIFVSSGQRRGWMRGKDERCYVTAVASILHLS